MPKRLWTFWVCAVLAYLGWLLFFGKHPGFVGIAIMLVPVLLLTGLLNYLVDKIFQPPAHQIDLTAQYAHRGLEVTIDKLSHFEEWMGFGMVMKPRQPGNKILVVTLRFRAKEDTPDQGKLITVPQPELEFAAGQREKCGFKEFTLKVPKAGKVATIELPFEVATGARLEALHLENQRVELKMPSGTNDYE